MRNWNKTSLLINFFNVHCFYSTYEELKHRLDKIYIPNEEMFLQYLWGIETIVVKFSFVFPVRFLQYLWGIETPICLAMTGAKKSFYSTYEELKQVHFFNPNKTA